MGMVVFFSTAPLSQSNLLQNVQFSNCEFHEIRFLVITKSSVGSVVKSEEKPLIYFFFNDKACE